MKKGQVLWFDDAKGYGFVEDGKGKSHFVHYTNIQTEGRKFLLKDQQVQFDVQDTDKGTSAINVSVI